MNNQKCSEYKLRVKGTDRYLKIFNSGKIVFIDNTKNSYDDHWYTETNFIELIDIGDDINSKYIDDFSSISFQHIKDILNTDTRKYSATFEFPYCNFNKSDIEIVKVYY